MSETRQDELFAAALRELTDDQETQYKRDVRAKLNEIIATQKQIAILHAKLDEQKEDLRELKYTPLKVQELLT